MDRKKINILSDKFADTYYKYQKGELNSEERKTFEKQLEEDKIKKMAADGLSNLSQEDFLNSKMKFIFYAKAHENKKRKLVKFIYAFTTIAAILFIGFFIGNMLFTENSGLKNDQTAQKKQTEIPKSTAISFGSSYNKAENKGTSSLPYPIIGYEKFVEYINAKVSNTIEHQSFSDTIVAEIEVLANGHIGTVKIKKGINDSIDLEISNAIRNGPLWKTTNESNASEKVIRKICIKN